MPHNIVLIGYRCTGKTTVGRLLAERLGWPFADVDDLIEATAGMSIKDIFATEGEAGFRDREALALAELCARPRCVVATGGGAVMRETNRARIKPSGFVVWLTASPDTVWERLQTDATTAARRPNLTSKGGEEEARELIATREPVYRELADFAVASDTLSPPDVTTAILTEWISYFTSLSSSGA